MAPGSIMPGSPEELVAEIRFLDGRLLLVKQSIDRLIDDIARNSLRGISPDAGMRQVEERTREQASILSRLNELRSRQDSLHGLQGATSPTDGPERTGLPPPRSLEEENLPQAIPEPTTPGEGGEEGPTNVLAERSVLEKRLAEIDLALSDLLHAEVERGPDAVRDRHASERRAHRFDGLVRERQSILAALQQAEVRLAAFRSVERERVAAPEDTDLPPPPPDQPPLPQPPEMPARLRGDTATPDTNRRRLARQELASPAGVLSAEEGPARGQGAVTRRTSRSRCAVIVQRGQLGEELSDADRAYLRRGCED